MENEHIQGFKRILLPIDGSRASENTLRYAVSMAIKYNAIIYIASIFSSKNPDSLFKKRIVEMNPNLSKEVEKLPIMYLMETYHGILKNAISSNEVDVKSVLIDDEITTKSVVKLLGDVIVKEKIDLLIISSHGKTGLKKLKLGSVTEKLMESVRIPIMCIK